MGQVQIWEEDNQHQSDVGCHGCVLVDWSIILHELTYVFTPAMKRKLPPSMLHLPKMSTLQSLQLGLP